jgi:hypothetical protein
VSHGLPRVAIMFRPVWLGKTGARY